MDNMNIFIAIIAEIVMLFASFWASLYLAPSARIAMQYGLDGKPTWTTSKWVGLLLTPALAAPIFGFVITLLNTVSASKGIAPLVLPVAVTAIILTLSHLYLLWRAVRSHG